MIIKLISFIITFILVLFFRKRTKTSLFLLIHNKKTNKMRLDKKTFVDAQLALFKAGTEEQIDATFSNVVLTSSDSSIFTADTDVDSDGTIDIVGVSVGTAILTVAADAEWLDNGETVKQPKTVDVEITVEAPIPGETDLQVSFSAAKPVPSPVTPVEPIDPVVDPVLDGNELPIETIDPTTARTFDADADFDAPTH